MKSPDELAASGRQTDVRGDCLFRTVELAQAAGAGKAHRNLANRLVAGKRRNERKMAKFRDTGGGNGG